MKKKHRQNKAKAFRSPGNTTLPELHKNVLISLCIQGSHEVILASILSRTTKIAIIKHYRGRMNKCVQVDVWGAVWKNNRYQRCQSIFASFSSTDSFVYMQMWVFSCQKGERGWCHSSRAAAGVGSSGIQILLMLTVLWNAKNKFPWGKRTHIDTSYIDDRNVKQESGQG